MSGVSNGLEDVVVEEFLYTKLNGDSALLAAAPGGVFSGPAPYETVGPWVSFAPWGNGMDITVADQQRLGTRGLWVVRGVCVGESYAPLTTIVSRIDAVLDRSPVTTVTDGIVWECWRRQPFSMTTEEGGQQYRHRGGIFMIYAKG